MKFKIYSHIEKVTDIEASNLEEAIRVFEKYKQPNETFMFIEEVD